MPASIGNLTSLQLLYLYSNELTGTIPSSIGNLTPLLYLFLSSNKLSGIIPSSIGKLTSLQFLFLSNNSLSGTIPLIIANISSFWYINVENNYLSSNIVTFLNILLKNNLNISGISFFNNSNIFGNINMLNTSAINRISLQYFMGHKCDLYGYFPVDIEFNNMQYFSVYDNRISGPLPKNLLNVGNINKSLILSANLIEINSEPPNWLSSSSRFVSAKSLYITNRDKLISYLLTIISGCFVLFILSQKLLNVVSQRKPNQTLDKKKNH
eukprot:431889_1